MKRIATVVALSGALLLVTRAPAADSVHHSPVSKRQMFAQVIDCMKKRMSADKNSSYNEAMKACKDQLNQERSTLGSGALVASDTAAKR